VAGDRRRANYRLTCTGRSLAELAGELERWHDRHQGTAE
jgi:hypothetical protein